MPSRPPQPDDRITAADRALLDGWRSEGLLYTTGPGMYDDWYWMLATVGRGDSQPVAVTNDAMRDHWVLGPSLPHAPSPPLEPPPPGPPQADLLPARDFARWRASKVVPFSFGAAASAPRDAAAPPTLAVADPPVADPPPAHEAPSLRACVGSPPPYSAEAQLLAGRWHVPLPDGAPEGEGGGAPEPVGQWLCVSVVPPPRVRRAGDPQVAVCR